MNARLGPSISSRRLHGRGRQAHARHSAAEVPSPSRTRGNDNNQLKEKLRRLSGDMMGHDLSADQRQQVELLATELASKSTKSTNMDLKGTRWKTIYTNAQGGSSRKIGPFVSVVTQTFHPTLPSYVNEALFWGALGLKLEGAYSVATTSSESSSMRIDLEFKNFAVELFSRVLYSKPFKPGEMLGHWKVDNAEDDLRIFHTNKGSLFILDRI